MEGLPLHLNANFAQYQVWKNDFTSLLRSLKQYYSSSAVHQTKASIDSMNLDFRLSLTVW